MSTLDSIQLLPSVGILPTIAIRNDVSLVYVERRGIDRLFDCVGRTFIALATLNVEVLLTSQSCAAGNFCFMIPAQHTFEVLNALKEEFQDEFESGEVVLIGAKNDVVMLIQQGASHAPTLYDILAQAHIAVLAAQGSPTACISAVIDRRDLGGLLSVVQPASPPYNEVQVA